MTKTILIIDDSALVLEMTKSILESAGYDVLVANDLAELEAHRTRKSPDLILMDVQMPEAFGDDVAMVLKAVRGEAAPIYLLSTLEEAELKRRAEGAEIDGYISKHVGADGLIKRVKQILEERPS